MNGPGFDLIRFWLAAAWRSLCLKVSSTLSTSPRLHRMFPEKRPGLPPCMDRLGRELVPYPLHHAADDRGSARSVPAYCGAERKDVHFL
jgi:hypothetical protein